MKTITIKQPYATLICDGIKDIENRSWQTKFRGRVLIHAAIKPIKIEFTEKGRATAKEITMSSALNHAEENDLFGCIIGSVEIIDCVEHHISDWAIPFYYHWVLANPIMFPEPIQVKGRLSFWDYPNILAEPEEKDGELFCHCQLLVNERMQVTGDSRFGYHCRYCGGRWYK